jgi:GMP synthase (glutamine-hydrolysing)
VEPLRVAQLWTIINFSTTAPPQRHHRIMKNTIVVLDFGGQYAHLIANRIRRLGVYSEILDGETLAEQIPQCKGIILSGGPQSVYDEKSPQCDPKIFDIGVPVLGICYGHQLMQHALGGKVASGKTREYGFAELTVKSPVGIFENMKPSSRVWMSHFDLVSEPAPGFEIIGETPDCSTAALADTERNFYGIQFHAEVTHTDGGMKILDNFLNVCDVKREWNIEKFMEEEIEVIKNKIEDKKVFLLVSGGVDSTVCFALLEKALGKERVHG